LEKSIVSKAPIIAAVAALQGAAGVSLAAAGAHGAAAPLLTTASQFLMIHACAGLALSALSGAAPALPRFLAGATFALQAGVTLFSADLAARVYLGGKLFPYAAPLGGSLTIAAWLALAVWACARIIRCD
jgi:uncharacterized membrane protein YgdD (TMEM256/DUF423 family)